MSHQLVTIHGWRGWRSNRWHKWQSVAKCPQPTSKCVWIFRWHKCTCGVDVLNSIQINQFASRAMEAFLAQVVNAMAKVTGYSRKATKICESPPGHQLIQTDIQHKAKSSCVSLSFTFGPARFLLDHLANRGKVAREIELRASDATSARMMRFSPNPKKCRVAHPRFIRRFMWPLVTKSVFILIAFWLLLARGQLTIVLTERVSSIKVINSKYTQSSAWKMEMCLQCNWDLGPSVFGLGFKLVVSAAQGKRVTWCSNLSKDFDSIFIQLYIFIFFLLLLLRC